MTFARDDSHRADSSSGHTCRDDARVQPGLGQDGNAEFNVSTVRSGTWPDNTSLSKGREATKNLPELFPDAEPTPTLVTYTARIGLSSALGIQFPPAEPSNVSHPLDDWGAAEGSRGGQHSYASESLRCHNPGRFV